jgi:hypothetical protein
MPAVGDRFDVVDPATNQQACACGWLMPATFTVVLGLHEHEHAPAMIRLHLTCPICATGAVIEIGQVATSRALRP